MQKLELSTRQIQDCFPKRLKDTHKFTNGYVTVVAGSLQFPGCVRLAAHAAARVGAGGVIALIPESIQHVTSAFYPDIIVWQLKEHQGQLTHASAFEQFDSAQERSKAVLIGCGMGRGEETFHYIKECLLHTRKPCVLDADALYALASFGEKFIIEQAQRQWILTPHAGEFEHLLDVFGYISSHDIAKLAMKWNCTIVLKGFPAMIYLPNGECFENPTGNVAASTAGCGDVLSGIIAGLLAQIGSPEQAAIAGMYLAGKVADDYVLEVKAHSLLASDIIERLPITLGEIISI
ncbi:NAD(P)H-hydrate dehydratase [Candidatus Paracaedibacter symbiosus]|uniref:NAD(P)H-hydrate dehydratase n=1 Tax=Candidatus Paracaedibacter symbiosus TaxID=244582 RepID=UPI000509E421|nr:NAD(P)H-hydrate dehydratase [Candidatus Paracaedibacter symbiosus]